MRIASPPANYAGNRRAFLPAGLALTETIGTDRVLSP